MPSRLHSARSRLVFAALALVVSTTCSHKSATHPGTTPLALDNAWPVALGRDWECLETLQPLVQGATTNYTDSASVPAVTIDDAVAMFAAGFDSTGVRDSLHFDLVALQDTVGASGVHASVLQQFFTPLSPGAVARLHASPLRATRPVSRDVFILANPTFLRACLHWRTPAWIGGWSGADSSLETKFLDADLSVGHTFTLVPSGEYLAGTRLSGRVVGEGTAIDPGTGKSVSAVQVVYLFDFGAQPIAFSGGHPMYWGRRFDCGRITWAAGVGPVADEERIGCIAATPHVGAAYVLRLRLLAVKTIVVSPPR